jgi:hypothetical protein
MVVILMAVCLLVAGFALLSVNFEPTKPKQPARTLSLRVALVRGLITGLALGTGKTLILAAQHGWTPEAWRHGLQWTGLWFVGTTLSILAAQWRARRDVGHREARVRVENSEKARSEDAPHPELVGSELGETVEQLRERGHS